MKIKNLLIFGIVLLLVLQVGFVFSNGLIEEVDVASFSTDAIEYTVPEEGTNRLTFIKEIIGDVKLTIGEIEFKNILSQEQAGHPSYIELDNFGNITKVDFTVNENGGIYTINDVEFEVPGNSRIYYDQETGFKFPKGTQIKSIRGITVNKETGRIAPTAFNKEIFFEGEDVNLFDELFVNGKGSISKKGFLIDGEANYKGMRISGEDNILIVTDPLTDLSNYKGNWIKQTPTTLGFQSSEGSSFDIEVLENNDILNNDKDSRLNINLENGDGIEITKGIEPRILHKSSENGRTFISNGELGQIELNKDDIRIHKEKGRGKYVAMEIQSDSKNLDLELEINDLGELSMLKAGEELVTFNKDLAKKLEDFSYFGLKRVSGGNEDIVLKNVLPVALDNGLSIGQTTGLVKNIVENSGEFSYGILEHSLPSALKSTKEYGLTPKQSFDIISKIVENEGFYSRMALDDGLPVALEYTKEFRLTADESFDLINNIVEKSGRNSHMALSHGLPSALRSTKEYGLTPDESFDLINNVIGISGKYSRATLKDSLPSALEQGLTPDQSVELITKAVKFSEDYDVQRELLSVDLPRALEYAEKYDITFEQLINKFPEGFEFYSKSDVRERIKEAEDLNVVRKLLKEYKQGYYEDPGWDNEKMLKFYSNDEFIFAAEGLTNTQRWDLAVTGSRLLEKTEKELSRENIELATKEIIKIREETKNKVISDENTNVLIMGYFQGDKPDRIFEKTGAKIKTSLKGPEKKEEFLNSLENTKGNTAVVFDTHGYKEGLWLGDNTYILYDELGRSLIKKAENSNEKLNNVNMIIGACHSYDFKENLYSYLQEKYQSTGKNFGFPNIITSTNRNQVSYGSAFLEAISEANEDSKEPKLTFDDFFRASEYGRFFELEDMSITIGEEIELRNLFKSQEEAEENKLDYIEISDSGNSNIQGLDDYYFVA